MIIHTLNLLIPVIIINTVPTGTPRNVVTSATSRSVNVSWDSIDCIESNGVITGYEVEFSQMATIVIPLGEVVGETFTADSLQPFSVYTFRVAGVNIAGRGQFTDVIIIRTLEDGVFFVMLLLYTE